MVDNSADKLDMKLAVEKEYSKVERKAAKKEMKMDNKMAAKMVEMKASLLVVWLALREVAGLENYSVELSDYELAACLGNQWDGHSESKMVDLSVVSMASCLVGTKAERKGHTMVLSSAAK